MHTDPTLYGYNSVLPASIIQISFQIAVMSDYNYRLKDVLSVTLDMAKCELDFLELLCLPLHVRIVDARRV